MHPSQPAVEPGRPTREYPFTHRPRNLAQTLQWWLKRTAARVRYRWRCLTFAVGPDQFRKVVGWTLAAFLLVAPIAYTALLEKEKLAQRPELRAATVAWVVLTLVYLLYSQVSSGSEFDRWSRLHGKTVNELGGGIEQFSRLLRAQLATSEKPDAGSIRELLGKIVVQSRDAVAQWVKSPPETTFRAYLVVPESVGNPLAHILVDASEQRATELPFGRVDAERDDTGLAYRSVFPRVVEDTRDHRHGGRYETWGRYRSFVSFPIVVGRLDDYEWLGCLNIESSEAYVFQAAVVQDLLAKVLRPQVELAGLILAYTHVHGIRLR